MRAGGSSHADPSHLAWIHKATPGQRFVTELEFSGVWWPEIDEGVSVKSLLLGWKAPGAKAPEKAA